MQIAGKLRIHQKVQRVVDLRVIVPVIDDCLFIELSKLAYYSHPLIKILIDFIGSMS